MLYLFSSSFHPLFLVWLSFNLKRLLSTFVMPFSILNLSISCPHNRRISKSYMIRLSSRLWLPIFLMVGREREREREVGWEGKAGICTVFV